MNVRIFRLVVPLVLFLATKADAQSPAKNPSDTRISAEEIKIIKGNWSGTLTYIDYTSNKPFSMPAELLVENGNNGYQFILNYNYPNEPQANSRGKFKLSKDGSKINKKQIVSIERADEGLIAKTEYKGKDNRREAVIRNSYLINADKLVISKEVRFELSEEWLKRNEYSFKRRN